MAVQQRLKDINNTGFGPNSSLEGGRLVNADGSTNLKKRGIPIWERISVYHTLLRMNNARFALFVLVLYTSVNLLFAGLYYVSGVEHLAGADNATTPFEKFTEAFFFSSQTLTTVGYGRVAPTGMMTNVIASAESLVGILIFAVMTGLIYGRFSRPRAYLLFSPNILIAPYKDGKALMFRIATYKNNHLTDVEAQLTLGTHVKENGKVVTKFYPLKLEFARLNSLALSWTIVHPIDDESPLHNITKEEVMESRMEVIVSIKAFDDHFSNIVQQRTSYTYKQVIYGAKFLPMFERAGSGDYTLLELNKINAHVPVELDEKTA
jgi:inward rectifier potassium channel